MGSSLNGSSDAVIDLSSDSRSVSTIEISESEDATGEDEGEEERAQLSSIDQPMVEQSISMSMPQCAVVP